jgi:hypothetical protein
VLTDPKTGNFTVTQKLDMVGYWNIFVINGAQQASKISVGPIVLGVSVPVIAAALVFVFHHRKKRKSI